MCFDQVTYPYLCGVMRRHLLQVDHFVRFADDERSLMSVAVVRHQSPLCFVPRFAKR